MDEINSQIQYILKQEKIEFEADATALVSKAANGSMRDALSLLDQTIAFCNGRVMTDDTRAMLGSIDQTLILEILNALADQNANQLVETTAKLSEHGVDFSAALKELMLHLHTITLLQVAPGQVDDPALAELAQKISAENVQLYYQIGLIGQRDLAYAPTLQSGFEMTLLRMLAFTPSTHQGPVPQTQTAQQAKPVTATPTAQPAAAPRQTPASNNWHDLFMQLKLTGAARMLAEQCSLTSQTDNKIELALNSKHKALLQDAMVKRITDSLNQHFQCPIQLSIKLAESTEETPADVQVRKAEQTQQQAEQAIYNDTKVQQIIKAFDAKIIKDSIKPVTLNSGEDT